jgi:hypothetical protein
MKEELLIPLVGAVAVALIAGGISLVLAVLAKDQKTSEFRQAWIDLLRDDVSKYIGICSSISTLSIVVRKKSQQEVEEFVLSKHNDFVEAAGVATRIRLRLNRDEHKRLIALVTNLDGLGMDKKAFDDRIEEIVVESQSILKGEWERVKRGEFSYRVLKLISAAILLGSVIAGVWLFIIYKPFA